MKNMKKILAFLLALTMLATLFVGCGKEETEVEAPVDEAVTETETEPAELAVAHHVNAHGLQSYSIHYFTDDDGSTAFEYMNEAGELVTVSAEDVEDYMDEVIVTCEDYTLTNRELLYAYQDQYYQLYQMYGMYLMLMMDTSKGLDEQVSSDGVNTWQHMFVENGANLFHGMAAVITEAKANGFDTTAAMEMVAQTREQLEAQAEQVGYEDVSKFVVDYMGPGASLESYLAYNEMKSIFQSYAEHLQAQVEVTEEEIDTYWAENEETLTGDYGLSKIDKNVVNVRHILISPEETTAEDGTTSISDEAWAEAEAKANSIYEEWKAGEATEDSFAALATAHTEDTGSAETGGLYEAVYPGQMVAEFEDWCFADGRAVGDTGIVKTTYGYHIMFFSGEGDYIYWRKSVQDLIISEQVNAQLVEIQSKYPAEIDLTKAVILDATAPTVPTAEEETAEPQGFGEYDYETGVMEDPEAEEHVHTEGDGHEH